MAAPKIGKERCPLCRGTADVSLAKSGLVVLTMNCCNAQLFTRSGRSDELVRDLLLPNDPAPASGSQGEPLAPAAPAPVVDEVDPVPAAPAPAPVTKRSPFGLIGM